MRAVLVVALAAACSGPNAQSDAGTDSRSTPPHCPPPPGPLCSTSCGNNVVDTCWFAGGEGGNCASYASRTEQCDGTVLPKCQDLGYYGGTGTCSKICDFTVTGCTACATGPGITACDAFAGPANGSTYDFAVNETTPGALFAVSGFSGLTVVSADSQGLSLVATPALGDVLAMLTVPGGWLLVSLGSGTSVRRMDTAGVVTAPVKVWEGSAYHGVGGAYGAGSRALLAWVEWDAAAQTSKVWFAVLDATGSVVVTPTALLPTALSGSPERIRVTTDGTSFFVATTRDNVLRRIGSDGALLSSTTIGSLGAPMRELVWSGTTGWWIARDGGSSLTAQRFDSSGALVGNAVQAAATGTIANVIARDDELVAVQGSPTGKGNTNRIAVERIDTAGNVSTPIEVGIDETFVLDSSEPRLASVGPMVAVTWDGAGRREIALVTP